MPEENEIKRRPLFAQFASAMSGLSKAERDIKLVIEHEVAHQARHEMDDNYDCIEDNEEFFTALGNDVNVEDEVEVANYSVVVNVWFEKFQARHLPSLEFLPIEVDGTETHEEMMEKVSKAIETQVQLEAVVSETGDPEIASEGKDA